MTNDCDHLRIHQFLRNRGADFRVSLVVLGHEFYVQYFAVDLDLFGVGLINREANTALVIFAQVRDGTRQRARVCNRDRDGRLSRRFGCFGRRFRFFLAAANEAGSEHGRKNEFVGIFHRCISKMGGIVKGMNDRKRHVRTQMLQTAIMRTDFRDCQ